MGTERIERREIAGQARDDELVEVAGSSQVLEAMLAQITQGHPLRQSVLHQFSRCLGEQHLSPVSSAHDTCSAMHIHADVAVSRSLRLACMQTHAHLHRRTMWKGVGGESALGR